MKATCIGCGFTDEIQQGRKWFMTLGIILVLVGSCAVLFPVLFTLAIETFIGAVILFSGVLQVTHAVLSRRYGNFTMRLLSGLIPVLIGLLLLVYPVKVMALLTFILAVFFMLEGVARIVLSWQMRPLSCWYWPLIGGAVSLLLGLLIFSQWPRDVLWILGLFIGIDIVFAGWTFIMLAMSVGRMGR